MAHDVARSPSLQGSSPLVPKGTERGALPHTTSFCDAKGIDFDIPSQSESGESEAYSYEGLRAEFIRRLGGSKYEIEDEEGAYALPPGHFEKVRDDVEESDEELLAFLDETLRYTMFPDKTSSREIFLLKTASSDHEAVRLELFMMINLGLRDLGLMHKELSHVIASVGSMGTGKILFDGIGRHPDGQFRFRGSKQPGMVIEVGYSQKWGGKSGLYNKALAYLEPIESKINLVLLLEYHPDRIDKRPRLSLFRSKEADLENKGTLEQGTRNTIMQIERAPLEDKDGQPTDGEIELKLWEFGPGNTIYRILLESQRNLGIRLSYLEILQVFRFATLPSGTLEPDDSFSKGDPTEEDLDLGWNKNVPFPAR